MLPLLPERVPLCPEPKTGKGKNGIKAAAYWAATDPIVAIQAITTVGGLADYPKPKVLERKGPGLSELYCPERYLRCAQPS